MTTPLAPQALDRLVAEREHALTEFMRIHGEQLARACHEMARAFARGGRLLPFGEGAAATDAAHAAVEFMHPVIVGKHALPAIAPTNDPTRSTTLASVGRAGDIALAIAHGAPGEATRAFVEEARRAGALTIAMLGDARDVDADFVLDVRSDDPAVVQEVQETAYHVLWELVHVFFEHPGLLDDACITCGDVAVEATVVEAGPASATIEKDGLREEVATELVGEVEPGDRLLCHAGVALEVLDAARQPSVPAQPAAEPTGFLYPFLEREERDVAAVLEDIRASSSRKAADVTGLRAAIDTDAVRQAGATIGEGLRAGGTLIAFGNGGSSTDAQDVAADAVARGFAAVALVNDVATVTAVANDVGFERVFARQLIALGGAGDVAMAITTSGNSSNLLAGLEEAHRRGMTTCAIAGYDGGRMAQLEWLDHLFVVRSDYIPRIQEAQATIYHLLLEAAGMAR